MSDDSSIIVITNKKQIVGSGSILLPGYSEQDAHTTEIKNKMKSKQPKY